MMNKFKGVLALCLALVMAMSLVACSGDNKEPKNSGINEKIEEVVDSEKDNNTEIVKEDIEKIDNEGPSGVSKPESDNKSGEKINLEITSDEFVDIDVMKGVKFKVPAHAYMDSIDYATFEESISTDSNGVHWLRVEDDTEYFVLATTDLSDGIISEIVFDSYYTLGELTSSNELLESYFSNIFTVYDLELEKLRSDSSEAIFKASFTAEEEDFYGETISQHYNGYIGLYEENDCLVYIVAFSNNLRDNWSYKVVTSLEIDESEFVFEVPEVESVEENVFATYDIAEKIDVFFNDEESKIYASNVMGKTLPNLEWITRDGVKFSTGQITEERYIVELFLTTCSYCNKSVGVIDAFREKTGFQVISLALDNGDLSNFNQTGEHAWQLANQNDSTVNTILQNVPWVPAFIFVEDGVIQLITYGGLEEGDLEEYWDFAFNL